MQFLGPDVSLGDRAFLATVTVDDIGYTADRALTKMAFEAAVKLESIR
jgi:hypothetical protein